MWEYGGNQALNERAYLKEGNKKSHTDVYDHTNLKPRFKSIFKTSKIRDIRTCVNKVGVE